MPLKVISPVPAVVLLTSNPPSSSVPPTNPENKTSPAPDAITKLSLLPASPSNVIVVASTPKLTAPPPVVIVVTPSLLSSTFEVLNFTSPPDVVIATASPDDAASITIFCPPVAAV